jgi:hypothetical protein
LRFQSDEVSGLLREQPRLEEKEEESRCNLELCMDPPQKLELRKSNNSWVKKIRTWAEFLQSSSSCSEFFIILLRPELLSSTDLGSISQSPIVF